MENGNMKNNFFIKESLVIAICSISICGCNIEDRQSNKKSFDKPNVIFILADDLGIGDIGCYGQKIIKTPAIDKLALDGMKFMLHYSGSTVSAPSRCSLLTGKHTGNSAIRGNKTFVDIDSCKYEMNLPDEEITIGELFKDNGYKTACIGKWGLGSPTGEGHPNRQGFDYFYGYLSQLNAHNYYPYKIFENDEPVILNNAEYTHDLIINKALNFIENNSDNPFFLFLTPTIPHADLTFPPKDIYHYNNLTETPYNGPWYNKQDKPRAAYASMVTHLDNGVSKIIDLLERKGMSENTIVIFTSDNGVHEEGGHNPDFFDSNGAFRGVKRDLYEGGIHAPLIIKWPKKIKSEMVSFHESAFWDFMPTFCDILNTEVPSGIDGISFLPELLGEKNQKKHDNLYFEFHERGGKRAIIKDRWKLIQYNVNIPDKSYLELYNLNFDPSENSNVVNLYSDKVDSLLTLMNNIHKKNNNWIFEYEK